jgi:hypothetical protein
MIVIPAYVVLHVVRLNSALTLGIGNPHLRQRKSAAGVGYENRSMKWFVPLLVMARLRTHVAPVHLLIRMEPIVACAGDVTEKQSFSWAVAAATPMTSIPAASITIRIMLFPSHWREMTPF